MLKYIFKHILFIAAFIVFLPVVFGDSDHRACDAYADKGDKNYENYCNNVTSDYDPFSSCQIYSPTNDSENILKVDMIPFMPVPMNTGGTLDSSDVGEDFYGEHLEKIGLNSMSYIGVFPLEKAKNVYLETQNAVYNCSVLNAKKEIGEKIYNLMENDKSSNTIAKIKNLNDSINAEMTKRNCNTPPAQDKVSYKKILLKNITYNYCNYRFYLNYLRSFPKANIFSAPTTINARNPMVDDKTNYNQLTRYLNKQINAITAEEEHARHVYNTSFAAYNEFENTYGLHIMLTFIYDDYVQVRNNLALLLNPISQLAYKIPQAMCHSGCG